MFKPYKAKLKLETFGKLLQKKRLERKLDVKKLAKKASVNALTIEKIEKGGNTTMITLIKIADAMFISLRQLYEEVENQYRGF